MVQTFTHLFPLRTMAAQPSNQQLQRAAKDTKRLAEIECHVLPSNKYLDFKSQ
jgi:hypothetical protein